MKISLPRRSENECDVIEREESDNDSESDTYESVDTKLDEFSGRIPSFLDNAAAAVKAITGNNAAARHDELEQDENSGEQEDGPLNLSKPRRQADRCTAGREKDSR